MDISVIIPTLNEEKRIQDCITSIKSQKTKLTYEIIVSDSYSEDKTVKLAKKADKIVFAGKGIWRGRNKGVEDSNGKVLIFIDADTLIPPNYLDTVYSVLKDDSIAALTCGFSFSQSSKKLNAAAKLLNDYFTFRYLVGRGTLSGFNIATTRKVFDEVGGFPDSPLEDGKFGEAASKVGRIVFVPEPKVITSSRRLESQGLHGSLSYYLQLMLTTDAPDFLKGVNPLNYKDYFPIR
ncbi:glycosyltransferase [archaeon]|nr:glycosyltransferase [archaeon]